MEFTEQLFLRLNNQQYTVGPHSAGFVYLVFIDNRVFANHRQAAGSAGLLQVLVCTLEEVHVSKHREAAAPPLLASSRRWPQD